MMRRAAGVLFYAAALVFLVSYLGSLEWHTMARTRIGWGYLALGVLAGALHRFYLPLVWFLIVRDMGAGDVGYREYNSLYAKAWLGRYVPGKVAMVAARTYFAERMGVSRSVLFVCTFIEMGVQIVVSTAGGLIGIASLGEGLGAIAEYRRLAYGLVLVLFVALLPPVLSALLRAACRILERARVVAPPSVRPGTVLKTVFGSIVGAALLAVYVNLIVAAVDVTAARHPLFVWGAYSLAGALGTVAFFAPSGLGVREAVLLPLLALVVTKETALAMVVLARLAELVIDGVYCSASAWLGTAGAAGNPPRP